MQQLLGSYLMHSRAGSIDSVERSDDAHELILILILIIDKRGELRA